MKNTNIIILTGRLIKKPELKQTQSGASICDFTIAVNESKKVNDKWEEYCNFFDISCFGYLADNITKYKNKGDSVTVTGKLSQQRWEKAGQKQSRIIIKADEIEFHSTGQSVAKKEVTNDVIPDPWGDTPDDSDVPF